MATLTIKNLPDAVYSALTKKAKLHRRSINSEAIVIFEESLLEPTRDIEDELEQVRRLRESNTSFFITEEDLEFAKNEGRP